jgi:glycosyltransferase involved in cell wall biosynthesis
MIIHFLSKGSADQISGGYLYNRYVLDFLVATGYTVRYHEDSTRLDAISRNDCVIVDSIVLVELAELLLSMTCPTVLLLHVVPDASTPLHKQIAIEPEALEPLYARSLIVVTGNNSLRRVRRSFPNRHLDAVCLEPGVPANWFEKREYSETAITLLCVANYVDYKGHLALLKCLEGLQDLDWTLHLFGNTKLQPDFYDDLAARVSKHGLVDRIFCRAEIAHDEVNRQMLKSDMLIHLSEYESYSMVIAEAIASGLPVFAHRTGNHEVFGTSGLVHYIDDLQIDKVQTDLRSFMEVPSTYARLRRNATWQQRDWNDVGRDFAHLLEKHLWN